MWCWCVSRNRLLDFEHYYRRSRNIFVPCFLVALFFLSSWIPCKWICTRGLWQKFPHLASLFITLGAVARSGGRCVLPVFPRTIFCMKFILWMDCHSCNSLSSKDSTWRIFSITWGMFYISCTCTLDVLDNDLQEIISIYTAQQQSTGEQGQEAICQYSYFKSPNLNVYDLPSMLQLWK